MKKRFVYRRRKNNGGILLILFLIVLFLLALSFFNWGKINTGISNSDFLKYIISSSNASIDNSFSIKNVFSFTPVKLLGFYYDDLVEYDVDVDSDLLEDYQLLQEVTKHISDPYSQKNSDNPFIYIYNTHQLETYVASSVLEESVVPNVMMSSYLLREEFSNYSINSIVEEANLTDVLNAQGLSYSYSYVISRMFLEEAKSKYSSLEYFIDVHRDSATKDITFLTLNGKNYARVLFVVGLEHENYQDNLDLANALHNLIEMYYPGLSRGVYKKSGPGVNGVYNQDVDPNVILLECGGVDNTIEEIDNTIDAFAFIFDKYLKENL